jgi:hypothetical protein
MTALGRKQPPRCSPNGFKKLTGSERPVYPRKQPFGYYRSEGPPVTQSGHIGNRKRPPEASSALAASHRMTYAVKRHQITGGKR